jgi:hypothetical protein
MKLPNLKAETSKGGLWDGFSLADGGMEGEAEGFVDSSSETKYQCLGLEKGQGASQGEV